MKKPPFTVAILFVIAAAILAGDYLYDYVGATARAASGASSDLQSSPYSIAFVSVRSTLGHASTILGLELLLIAVWSLLLLGKRLWRRSFSGVLFALCFLLLGGMLSFAHLASEGRPVAAVGLSMPGSYFTRYLNLSCVPWLRRLIEPSTILLLLGMLIGAGFGASRLGRSLFGLTALCAGVLFVAEASILSSTVQQAISNPQ
ncbi:MAG: hypothetical protein KDD44_11540, partial [Bdellovibrionales bacterium]|nr:hypothetical protein [Bdellovibrionales bacterium]